MTRCVVIKLGGHALASGSGFEATLDNLGADLARLREQGYDVAVVHGAGPQIDAGLAARGVTPTFVDGLRVTDDDTLDVVATCLDEVNSLIVAGLRARGTAAVGVRGADGVVAGSCTTSTWGRVATDVTIRVEPVRAQLLEGITVVVSPLARAADGTALNANADTVAGALAGALAAEALVLLSDVDQLRRDPDDASTVVGHVTGAEIDELIASGAIRDGMRPKAAAALHALAAGASRVVLTNGTRPRAASDALSGAGQFTEVTK